MKKFLMAVMAVFCTGIMFAQSDDELFGGDDDFFFGDDDGIIEMEAVAAPKNDLSKGVLFETGSVKIGGNFELSLSTLTAFKEGKTFADSLKETTLQPVADAQITLDARPSENLRMFMKTGIAYPYVTSGNASLAGTYLITQGNFIPVLTTTDLSLRNMFYVKELFSDFNLGDNVAFRFGKQTVTWGVGYFFSPADVINSAIDPENPTLQVEGPLCLRTQIVFPGTQNALWAYLIPDNSFLTGNTVKARDTAMAAKAEFVLGGWELGLGGYYKYETAPRLCLTASGTLLNKISVFGEATGVYGQPDQWSKDTDKSFFAQATAGFMYNWKNPKITLMGQYYYNGQNDSLIENLQTQISFAGQGEAAAQMEFLKRKGHNGALAVNFGKVFSNDLSASIYAIANFTNESTIASAMLTYSPVNQFKLSFGPYVTWLKYSEKPVAAAKITCSLGGGKF